MRLEKWPLINRPIQLDKTNNGRGQRKVRSFWSNGFSASIIIPDKTLRPGRKLQGKVVIHSKSLVTFTGLRVQLDAQCTLFLEKNGELVTKRFSILQTDANNVHNNNANNQKRGSNGSTIQCEAVESLANSKEIYALIPDINSVVDATIFPFSLDIPGDKCFPCPFNNTVGTLVYKLSAHFCSQDLRYAQIAEETLDFKGYNNLSNNLEETGKGIAIERPMGELLNHGVSARFKVESSGFLSEEAVHFVLAVRNPRRKALHMKVLIAQKITYSIAENCWKRVTSTIVRCERAEVNHNSGGLNNADDSSEMIWRGALIIPKGQVPTFFSANNHPGYSVSYTLQFKVEGVDQDYWSLKGTAPLHIGTCRSGYYGKLITG